MGMSTTFGRIVGQDSDSTTDAREANEVGQALGAKDDAGPDRIRATPISDPVRVPRFIAMVERLRQRLSTAFPEQAHRIQMRAALGRLGKGRPGSSRVGRAGSRT